jgi:hypothetical protein
MTNIRLAAAEIARIASAVRAVDPDDDKLLADMIEAETDLHRLASQLLDMIEDDEAMVAALKAQDEARTARRKRMEERIGTSRRALVMLLEAAQLDKLMLPQATLSKRTLPPTVTVLDESAVPDAYSRFTKKPNVTAIKDAFVPGSVLPNWLGPVPARPSLTIRRN